MRVFSERNATQIKTKQVYGSKSYQWMDGLLMGEMIGSNVHHTGYTLKDQNETNRQTNRIRQYKKKKCS
jgi:hypothetical protein